ncbi:MAG: phosphonate ABC transporter, permease protein PhnE [Microbacteriaceae bacterium]|nr:phosphonate ABC transporter, permease protein PhnE [Microbacteriaceae bacterium]
MSELKEVETAPNGGKKNLTPIPTKPSKVSRNTLYGFLLAFVLGWIFIDMDLFRIFGGTQDIINLVDYMLPAEFEFWERALELTFETLWMAVIGTFLAILMSVPLAFMAASNTTPHPTVYAIARGIITFSRAVPDLVFALVFVRALGIGVLPGILALAFHSIGMIAKLLADAIEQADKSPREAVRSVGAGPFQNIITTVVPQIIPAFISISLYRLDINLRSSTVLGLVGAGGVGLLLKKTLGQLDYSNALGVVLVIFIFILLMEVLSAAVRLQILAGENFGGPSNKNDSSMAKLLKRMGYDPEARRERARARRDAKPNAKILPPLTQERLNMRLYSLLFLALIAIAFISVQLNPLELFTSFGSIVEISGRLLPPDFITAGPQIIQGLIETLAIAIVSTVLGSLISIPLGFLAAANVSVNRIVYGITRLVLVIIRGIPELILAIIFVAAIGLGPIPGVFALTIGTGGFLAKLVADSVEEIDPTPRQAVTATGATRIQELFTSVLPQVLPALVGQLLYTFDINIRASAILGIVGGGGIGFLLFNSMKVLAFQTTGAIILATFVLVYLIEILAGYVRRQII